LVLANVTTNNSGPYFVIVSASGHSATSQVAILTVVAPPSITQQPQPQVVDPGSNAVFTVTLAGTPPFRYQWRSPANQVVGTNSSLTLTNVQYTNTGNYKVLVANGAGAATSQTAELIVRPKITQGSFIGGAFRLTLTFTTNKQYAIESAPGIPNWSVLTNVSPSSIQLQYDDTSAPPASNRLYRLRLLP
jgi:hypothetical protein